MDKINIGEVLKSHNITGMTDLIIPPIKEIIESVIEKCADDAITEEYYTLPFTGKKTRVNKESILVVKEQINYDTN